MKNLATRENIMLCVVAVLALCAFNLNGRVGKLENRAHTVRSEMQQRKVPMGMQQRHAVPQERMQQREDARQKRMKKDAVR